MITALTIKSKSELASRLPSVGGYFDDSALEHVSLIECAVEIEKLTSLIILMQTKLDLLGIAISDAEYIWTKDMREAYEMNPNVNPEGIITKLLNYKVSKMREDRFWKDNMSYGLTMDEIDELKLNCGLLDVELDSNGVPKKVFGVTIRYDNSPN